MLVMFYIGLDAVLGIENGYYRPCLNAYTVKKSCVLYNLRTLT